jgi:hypothetical protein
MDEFLEIVGEAAVGAELASTQITDELVKWAQDEVIPVWLSFSPEDTGKYKASIHVDRKGHTVLVGSDDPIANLIEYGSEHNPEYAPRAKTEAHFGGGDDEPEHL